MENLIRILLKVLKWGAIAAVIFIVIVAIVHLVGRKLNNRTPDGGINETAFVDINGTKQWINIYGEDKDAPVLLYLHGGPFSATSAVDWTCLRKLSKDYIVVNWDQRGCGHNYPKYKVESAPTSEDMIQDGVEMTDYLLGRFGKEKITLMGMSWGSILGSNLAFRYPEKYDAMIALSLVVDIEESQKLFKDYMLEKSEGDEEMHSIAESIDPAVMNYSELQRTSVLISKYGYYDDYFVDADVNFLTTTFFNPYCTLGQEVRMIYGSPSYREYVTKTLMPEPGAIIGPLGLTGKTEYKVPYYVLEGKKDYGNVTMADLAASYFDSIDAPDKKMEYVDGGHNAPMMKTEKLAEFIHEIAEKQKK